MTDPSSAPIAFAMPAAVSLQGFTLRRAVETDRPFERALFETARPDAALLAAWPEDVRRPFLDLQFQFQTAHYARAHPQADRWVVASPTERIGRLILDHACEDWSLVDIALMPAWRGKGIGAALIGAVLGAAGEARARVSLSVDLHNRARALYERLGFVAVEEAFPNLAMQWRTGPQLNTA